MAKTGIIGAGSWGCALAGVLDKNGHEVKVPYRRKLRCSKESMSIRISFRALN